MVYNLNRRFYIFEYILIFGNYFNTISYILNMVLYSIYFAGLAHLVERHLAKVEVASSSLVTRSNGDVAKW